MLKNNVKKARLLLEGTKASDRDWEVKKNVSMNTGVSGIISKFERGGAGTGGGVLNWCNKPNLVRQGLIDPMKGPAPPGVRKDDEKEDSKAQPVPELQQMEAVVNTTPAAVKYGRKLSASKASKTPTTPMVSGTGSVKKRKTRKKVKMKEEDESSVRFMNLRSYFMKLTDDPKLPGNEICMKSNEMRRSMQCNEGLHDEEDDIAKASAQVCGEVKGCDVSEDLKTKNKVSASIDVPILSSIQSKLGDATCVRGDTRGTRVHGGVVRVSVRNHGLIDDGDGQETDEVDDDEKLYSTVQTVQNVGDEKAVLGPMKTGKLPRVTDQNQTLDSARVDCTEQSHIQTLQGETLVLGECLQRRILADNSAFCDQHDGSRGFEPE